MKKVSPALRHAGRAAISLMAATLAVAPPAAALQSAGECDTLIAPRGMRSAATAADSFAALVGREPVPGAAVAVVVDGELAWSATWGSVDVESGRPICRGTRFRTGSVSKVLTGLALLRLHDAGRIDLDADLRDLLPAVAHQPHPITPRQLAGHLGGIRHYGSAEEYLNTRRYDRVADAFGVFSGDSLVAPPGSTYNYSSYGYNLLGGAIETVADVEYVEAVRRLVLEPLGLREVSAETSAPAGALATPHSLRRDTLRPSPPFDPSDRLPSGGWVASAEDLARAGYALVDPAFLRERGRALVLTSQRTSAGEETGYSIGVRVGTDSAGRPILHHGGTTVGGRAFLLVYPDEGVSVAVVANGPAEFAEAAVGRIAEPFLRR